MTTPETHPAESPSPRFQFTLQTLLLLFVVLGSSLALFGAWGIVVFVFSVALAVYVHQAQSLPSVTSLVLVGLCLPCFLRWLLPVSDGVRESARSLKCTLTLKQIAAALQAYHQANGRFPPAYIADKNGKPMHSWRVLILPYLDYENLYKAYDFTQPWDGPKNKALAATPVMVYACPCGLRTRAAGDAQTNYVAVVGPNTAWPGEKSRKLGPADFPGGTSNTIMVVEVADSGINWAEPRDLSLETLEVAEDKPPALVPLSKHGRTRRVLLYP